MFRVLTVNLMQGGGTRKSAIVDLVDHFGPDVAVFSEYRASNGADLLDGLARIGLENHVGEGDPKGGHASVLIASRHDLTPGGTHIPSETDAHRWQHVTIDAVGWDLVGCSIPGSGAPDQPEPGHRKSAFWSGVLSNESDLQHRPTIITGDFNTGRHLVDERGSTFSCAESFESMLQRGWTDAFRRLQGEVWAPTWWSPRYGNGFRLDHALLSPGAPEPVDCKYVTEVDGKKVCGPGKGMVTDHALMVTDLMHGGAR